MKLFVGGSSHLVALRRGCASLDTKNWELKFVPFGSARGMTSRFSATKDGKTIVLRRRMKNNLRRFSGKTFFDPSDFWVLCMGNSAARILRDPIWKAAEPAKLASFTTRPVSRAMLEEIVRANTSSTREFFNNLRVTGVCFLVVFPPPLKSNHPKISRGIPITLVGAINAAVKDFFVDWLEERGLPYVLPPNDAVDDLGLLLEGYSKKETKRGTLDPHHANDEYGKLMMQKTLVEVERLHSFRPSSPARGGKLDAV